MEQTAFERLIRDIEEKDFKLVKVQNALGKVLYAFLIEMTMNSEYTTAEKVEAYEYLSQVARDVEQYISDVSNRHKKDE